MDTRQEIINTYKSLYFKNVNKLRNITGKRVAHNVYVHMDVIDRYDGDEFGISLKPLLNRIDRHCNITHDYNVVKLSTKDYSISLLNYPSFYKKFHPALTISTKVGLENMKSKTQKYITNRPILHRCETMMIPNSALQSMFCYQTQVENSFELYEDTKIIGRETTWVELLKSKELLEPLLNCQNEIARMMRQMPMLPITIVPDVV